MHELEVRTVVVIPSGNENRRFYYALDPLDRRINRCQLSSIFIENT